MGNKRAQRTRAAAQRRQFARIAVALPVTGRAPQFREMVLHGMVRSVGVGGMLVEFPVEVLPGSILRLALQTALGPLEVKGRVVWTAASRGTIRHGLAFPEPEDPTSSRSFSAKRAAERRHK